MERYTRNVEIVFNDGSRSIANLQADERLESGAMIYKVTVRQGSAVTTGESENGFFDALRRVRHELETENATLYCFGASEDVYPSPMQESMGPALLAYRNHLGQQARSTDIVNIFDTDESVRPSTVEQQRLFHERWLRSL
jgi:hypothetical protein